MKEGCVRCCRIAICGQQAPIGASCLQHKHAHDAHMHMASQHADRQAWPQAGKAASLQPSHLVSAIDLAP